MKRRLIQPWLFASLLLGAPHLASAQSDAKDANQTVSPPPSAGAQDGARPAPSTAAVGVEPSSSASLGPAPTAAPLGADAPPSAAPLNPTAPATAPSAPSTAPAVAPSAPPTATAPPIVPTRFTRPKWGWDVNLEGAYGRYFPDHQRFGFGRVRGGMLYSADPVFYAIGLTYEWSNLAPATFGIQAEALHIESGVWVQAGALGDTQVHPGAQFALGWSVLGIEAQYRKFDPSDWGWALVGKLRIPVTFIAKAFE